MTLDKRFPSVDTMEAAAAKRLPKFMHDYLIGGIGPETCVARNRQDLHDILLMPRYLSDAAHPNIKTTILGHTYDAPFGVAPMGLSGLMWPNLERILALAAKDHNVPYVLSTFSNISLEKLKPLVGDNGWFQFYPPNDPEVAHDLLTRTANAGYHTLVVTVDIPAATRRERDMRNGLSVPPKFDSRTLWHMLTRPAWALKMLRAGVPEFETLKPYFAHSHSIKVAVDYISEVMKGHITAERFSHIRDVWQGSIVVKGVLDSREALQYMELGADGIIVSNHGGRQLDAAPSSVRALPNIRTALGKKVPIFADGGMRSGLDIAKMLALGADFVFLGRPFVYGAAAIGNRGGDHVMHVLKTELSLTLSQIGCPDITELPHFLMA